MVSDLFTAEGLSDAESVLILVLMEYGLWQDIGILRVTICIVLILVLMEYGLWRRSGRSGLQLGES